MIKLFDDTQEIIEGPSNNNENTFNYYHKSNRYDMKIIRTTLEKWFTEYPETEQNELKIRFKKDFDSSFFELFLYNFFKKLGYTITVHPELINSTKRPDFLIVKDGYKAYVEAKICYDKTEEEMAFERLQNVFYDNLNKTRIKGFLLRVEELSFITRNQPRVKELIELIEYEVKKLDPVQMTSDIEKYGFDVIPRITFKNKDFKIILQPLPLKESKKDKISKNPIGMLPFETYVGGGEESLRQSIIKKAKRYGKFEIPYLICLNALGVKMSGKFDIENVIWGALQYTFSTDPNNRDTKMTRKSDGIFFNANKIQLRNVSGILVTKVFPSNIPNAKYWLYKNPFANYDFDFEKSSLIYSYVHENRIISKEGSDFDRIFGIDKDWLDK